MIVTLYKKTISRLLIFTACLLLGQLAIAQQYPVQIVPQLLPPYTLNVSDYYNGTNEKLVLLLTNTDLNKPTLQVRLRMSIQGQAAKLISRDNVYYPAISLDGGVPTRITLGDLAPYFNADNLIFEGITRAQYVQSGKLPEGFYQFCFEAVEVSSNQVVGRSSCAMAWISLSDPPLLNLPRKTESIVYKDPQNIIFQWTPRNYNSPTSAFNTEYEFTLVEIWDNGLAPEAAFGTAQPLYRTTTQATTLLYGPGEPLLLSGHKYAWRVRAQQTNGTSGSDAWRNNGYSEIYWFNCQSDCSAPLNVQHELSSGRATITWSSNPNQTSFTVDYREKGQNGSTWYNSATTANRMMLYDLKKDKTYEYRVGGTCDNGITYTYSDIKTLVMAGVDSAVNANCGMLVAEENIKNRTPIQTLLTGDVITAGDFPVKLLQVSGQGAFTGAGYVTVPFIGQSRVKVKFTGITVNTDKQLIGGVIETTYDAKESQIGNLDEVIDGGGGVGIVVDGVDTAGYYVDMVIPDARSIDVELNKKVDSAGNSVPGGGATLTITGSDGATKQVKVEELPATIKDKNGTIYGVDKDGNVSKVASSEPMNMTAAQLNTLQTDKAVVKFQPHENQTYAFDEYQPVYSRSVLFNEEYEKLNDGYHVNSKAIVEAKPDVVKAVVEKKDNSIIVDSIRFVTGKGTRYESKKLTDSTWEIKIVGGPAADAQELYALYPQGGGKFLSLGKLLIASYPERTFKVVLVPVNGATVNKDAISKKLEEIYKPVGITFQVTQDKSFDDKSWDLVKDGKLAVSGSGWLSTLTDEMKALNNAYSSARTVQQDAVYLFVLSGSDSSSTLAGDMPRGKQFGYLFNGTDGKVAAHEIGHGLFSLKHVFDNNYGFKQGELPSNVMDYPAGDRFAKHQWDLMYKPGVVIGLFEKDADAQSHDINIEGLLTWINENKGKKAQFKRNTYFNNSYNGNSWVDVPLYFTYNLKKCLAYAEVYDDGEVDFQLVGDKNYSAFSVQIDHKAKLHTGFKLSVKYSGSTKNAFTIWTKTYEDYEALLKKLSLDLPEDTRKYFVETYKTALIAAAGDCNKLDVVYENMPPFVIEAFRTDSKLFTDDERWVQLKTLGDCSVKKETVFAGTDENKSILNLLFTFDKTYLYNKVNLERKFFRALVGKLDGEYMASFGLVLATVAADVWTEEKLNKAPEFLLYEKRGENMDFITRSPADQSGTYFFGCFNFDGGDWYSFGTQIQVKDAAGSPDGPLSKCYADDCHYFDAVKIETEEYECYVPAFFAYELALRAKDKLKRKYAGELVSVLLPEAGRLTLKVNRLLKLIRAKNVLDYEKILLRSLDRLSLDGLKADYLALDEVLKPQFAEDFFAVHDDVLGAMQNEEGVFKAWVEDCRSTDINELFQALERHGIRDEYNALVSGLADKRLALIAEGKSKLEIAQTLNQMRRDLTIKYKHITPKDLMEWIFKRNDIVYVKTGKGDLWGATWDGLVKSTAKELKILDLGKATAEEMAMIYDKIAESSSITAAPDKMGLGVRLKNVLQPALDPAEYQRFVGVLEKYRMNPK